MSFAHDARPAGVSSSSVSAEMPVGDPSLAICRHRRDDRVRVISIHNMPILDAIFRQQRIRAGARRAGAMNMADAALNIARAQSDHQHRYSRRNAAGSQVEALTAGSPVLHITSR